jgi:DNA polymerase-1
MPPNSKVLLVDGSYFAYRSFYAIREIYGGGDMSKNALFGFCRDLKRMTERCRTEMVGVVWDGGIPESRSQLLPEYKQQRPSMPDELRSQIPLIEDACDKMGIQNLRVKGQEADDLIASYTREAKAQGVGVTIATNDKDIFQLVDEGVCIYTTVKKYTGGESHTFLGSGEVCAIWGVGHPRHIRDVLALTGDTSDNIPGVPGIGPKTASKLIKSAGGVEALAAEPSKHANPRLVKLLEDHKSLIERNMKIVGLDEEIPLPARLSDLIHRPSGNEVAVLLRGHGFSSLARDWEKNKAQGGEGRQGELF